MSVFKGSRYEGVKFTGILGKDGKVRRYLHAREPFNVNQMRKPLVFHDFQQDEQLDQLAWEYSGKPRLWWLLADISKIMFPLEIEPGTEIIIPTRELQAREEIG
jgi:hypothetical protein